MLILTTLLLQTVTDQYSEHGQCNSFLFSPFHPLLLVSPVSEFISPLDLLKVVQFLVERTLSPSFLSVCLPAIWPTNRKPFNTELLLRNKVERFHLNITRNLELSRSIHSECPRKAIEKVFVNTLYLKCTLDIFGLIGCRQFLCAILILRLSCADFKAISLV